MRTGSLMLVLIWIAEIRIVFKSEGPPKLSYASLNNTHIPPPNSIFTFACFANYPIEWVHDDDPERENKGSGTIFDDDWGHWTQRLIRDQGGQYVYSAHSSYYKLGFLGELGLVEILVCRSVLNHSDSILVKMKRTKDGNVYVSDSKSSMELEGLLQITQMEDELIQQEPCLVQFVFAEVEEKYFVKCSLTNDSNIIGNVTTHECHSSPDCANSFRMLKKQISCVNVLANNSMGTSSLTNGNWYAINSGERSKAGTAVCKIPGGERQRSAVEYFFSTSGFSSKIHFSLTEIKMEDLIWLDPIVFGIYYVSETMQTTCNSHIYGFSDYPMAIVTWNGVEVYKGTVEENRIDANSVPILLKFQPLGKYTVGEYKINCIAPIWNTTAWTNKTNVFTVKEIVAPYFEDDFEILNVTFEAMNEPLTVNCDVLGEPNPLISWDLNKTLAEGSRTEGRLLVLRNSPSSLKNGTIISCTGTNRFNQTARKRFQILRMHKLITDSDKPNLTLITVIPIMVSAILAGIIAMLYFKIVKHRRDMTVYLSEREIREFREGTKAKVENVITGDEEVVILSDSMPYNTTLDVSKDRISVDLKDNESLLGFGEYGVVFKGSLKTNSRERNVIPIAVKTIRPNAPLEYFKALMSELKILAHIGSHENIVNLVCAWTSNLKKRELFVGIELCQKSLLELLKENRATFNNCMSEDGMLLAETSLSETNGANQNKPLSTHDLLKWAEEIACGMEYLSTRKVVHGDLATRNILISFNMHAKISDFGLAKQLVNYTYLRLDNCKVPWAWMAPESLRDKKFTAMTDTWSYGVVLWELFTLGKHPFSGYIWSISFLEELERGLRNPKPKFANDDIYKVMIGCWRPNPKERPNFHVLKEYFGGTRVE